MKLKIIIIFSFISTNLFSQSISTWNVLDLRKNTGNKFSYQLEAQLRSLKFYKNFHYNEVNFTANYKYDNNLILSLLY
jgi:hypothetical protein